MFGLVLRKRRADKQICLKFGLVFKNADFYEFNCCVLCAAT